MNGDNLHQAIVKEASLRLNEESLARILQCIDSLDDTQLWYSPNTVTNSVGNLVLHLNGNIRQYLCHGIGGERDVRKRESEFIPKQFISKALLKSLISAAIKDGLTYVNAVSPKEWLAEIDIQVFTMTRYSALIHVIEHTSYHVGQITYLTKEQTGNETGYYEGLEL